MLRLNSSTQTKKESFGKLHGVSSKKLISHIGTVRQRRLLITRLLGKSYQELIFASDSAGCYLGHMFAGERVF